jgi:hypothetical protein
MHRHTPILLVCAALALVLSLAAGAETQWTLPRTDDGQPDLQGIWTNGTLTPFERPEGQAGKAVLTEEESLLQQRQVIERREKERNDPNDVGSDNEAFIEHGYQVLQTRQASLVVDPPDGRIRLRPESERRRDFNLSNLDTYESLGQWERCITRAPTSLFPSGYNNGFQIVQTRSHIVIVAEMVHDARVILMDGSPHVDARVTSWMGDSRGHWEGDTLVVDTTNFNDRGWIATNSVADRLLGVPSTESLHMVERFTRVSAATINYQMTVDDQAVYSAPWTVAFPFTRDDHYQMFEYACHEGNQAIELMLRGARVQESKEAEAAKK